MTIDTPRLRVALLEERDRIEKALESLRDDEAEEPAVSDNHLAETATATLDREIDDTLEENSTRMLTAIDAALARVEAGTYGACENCRREISAERLEAYPWAALCIDCKREAERG
jgi:DnaK suppressor protein